MVFGDQKDNKKINKVILKQNGNEKRLFKSGFSMDVSEGKVIDAYSISPYSIELSLKIESDAEIIFGYRGRI